METIPIGKISMLAAMTTGMVMIGLYAILTGLGSPSSPTLQFLWLCFGWLIVWLPLCLGGIFTHIDPNSAYSTVAIVGFVIEWLLYSFIIATVIYLFLRYKAGRKPTS